MHLQLEISHSSNIHNNHRKCMPMMLPHGYCMVSQILLEENQMTSAHVHRDNGFATFKPQLSCEDISNCRSKIQQSANRLADANCALFMCGEW